MDVVSDYLIKPGRYKGVYELDDGEFTIVAEQSNQSRSWKVVGIRVGHSNTSLLSDPHYGCDPAHPIARLNYVPYITALEDFVRAQRANKFIKSDIAAIDRQMDDLQARRDALAARLS